MNPRARLLLLACALLTIMAGPALAPSMPGMRAAFGGEHADRAARVILTVPSLTIALASPWVGRLRWRWRTILSASLWAYAALGTCALLASGALVLALLRAAFGVAVAGVMTSSTALAAELAAEAERPRFFAQQAACMSAGGVLFVSLGGVLAEVHWRAPFALYAMAAPLALGVRRLPGAARVLVEVDGAAPGSRGLPLAAFVAMLVYFVVPTHLPFVLASAAGSGAALALGAASAAVSALLSSRALRVRPRRHELLALAFALLGAGTSVLGSSTAWPMLVCGLVTAGAGLGLVMPNLSTWVIERSAAAGRARAIGALSSAVFLGQFLSPLVAEALAPRAIDARFCRLGSIALAAALVVLVAHHCVRRTETRPSC